MAVPERNVWVRGHGWFGPSYPDNGSPPEPQPDEPVEAADSGPPPKSGKGSTDAAWTAYARSQGLSVTDEMRRAEVIAACEKAGVPTD